MFKKIAKALGLETADLTAENSEAKILDGIKALKEAHKAELKEASKPKKASLEDPETKELVEAEIEKATTEVRASLKITEPKDADPVMVGLVETNRRMILDAAVAASRITPDVRKEIETKYGENKAIAASLKKGDAGDSFEFLMSILTKNDPIKLAEQTGAQVIKASLADPNKGQLKDEDNPLLKDADKRIAASKK